MHTIAYTPCCTFYPFHLCATAAAAAAAATAGTANSGHRAAAEGACGVLRNLCAGSATAKTAAGDAGACTAVVACLTAFKGDCRLQLAALAAARNLGGGHAGNRQKLVRSTVVQSLYMLCTVRCSVDVWCSSLYVSAAAVTGSCAVQQTSAATAAAAALILLVLLLLSR
jgi:hypothetical protein